MFLISLAIPFEALTDKNNKEEDAISCHLNIKYNLSLWPAFLSP